MWAYKKKNFSFLLKTQHNQSQPSPFPDDEITIRLSEIWSGIFRLPMDILHINKTMLQAASIYSVQTLWLWGSNALICKKKVSPGILSIQGMLLKVKMVMHVHY